MFVMVDDYQRENSKTNQYFYFKQRMFHFSWVLTEYSFNLLTCLLMIIYFKDMY